MFLGFKLFIAVFILAASVQAGAGNLDTTFGAGGIVITGIPNSTFNEATGIVVQPDGKLVISASANGVSGLDVILARYNPDGSLDTSFSGDGIVTTPFGNEFDSANAIALQSDGKILIAGRIGIFPSRFLVIRYNADGTLDTTFDGDGIVTTAVLQNSNARALAVQTDGKIVAAGNAVNSGGEDFFTLVRYNPDGAIDSSFGNAGMVFTSFGAVDLLNDLIVQTDGKIVAVGTGNAGAQTPLLAMIRLHPNGSFDTGFNGSGRVASEIPLFEEANSVELQSDGKIIVGGQLNGYFSVFRYFPNGTLDTGFDGDGAAQADFEIYSRALDIKVQPDGKIVGVGESFGDELDFAAARFNPDGSLDQTFGIGGKVTTAVSGGDDSLNRLAIQPDGKIVGAGVSGVVENRKITLARYFDRAPAPVRTKFDYDGDGRTDISVFRRSDRVWYLNQTSAGFAAVQFGLSSDKIAPADYDADGKTDICVFRDGTWYWLGTSNGTIGILRFGTGGDVPTPADFTGDGRAEIAVYRAGAWWMYDLATGQASVVNFGLSSDKPVPADFDGDGQVDQAIYRGNGEWHLNRSRDGYAVVNFGLTTDLPVVGDYDGDGRADSAVYRAGIWYVLQSSRGFTAFQWGISTDVPVASDYDGDGKTDAGVYRDGVWYLLQSANGVSIRQFGLANDQPTPAAFLPD